MKFVSLILAAGIAVAADKTAFDKVALEAYLRHLELWIPEVKVQIDDAKKSTTLPGFAEITVHLSYNNQTKDEHYYVSADGKKVFKTDIYDINKNPFQANLDLLKANGAPSFGSATAPVTIFVFSDFQCPLCKQEAEILRKNIAAAFPDKVRLYFKDFPLDQLHNWARSAAVAGRCVYKINPGAFWDYHDFIYDNQTYIGLDNLNNKVQDFAHSKNIDGMQLSRCIETKMAEPEVVKSVAEGQALGVVATPTLYINGRKLEGAVPWESLQALINIEIDHQAKAKAADDACCTVNIPKIVK